MTRLEDIYDIPDDSRKNGEELSRDFAAFAQKALNEGHERGDISSLWLMENGRDIEDLFHIGSFMTTRCGDRVICFPADSDEARTLSIIIQNKIMSGEKCSLTVTEFNPGAYAPEFEHDQFQAIHPGL